MTTTPVSLLERLRQPADQEAWGRFVHLYSPLLFSWARHWGLQADDAADLAQDVFATLVQKLPDFVYDRKKSFRSWLRVVTINHYRDRQRRTGTRPLPGNAGQLADVPAFPSQTDREDDEDRLRLVQRTLQVLRNDFHATTWQAFQEHGLLGRPAAEVAAQLGLTVAAVYCARGRVLSRLRQELQGLLD